MVVLRGGIQAFFERHFWRRHRIVGYLRGISCRLFCALRSRWQEADRGRQDSAGSDYPGSIHGLVMGPMGRM